MIKLTMITQRLFTSREEFLHYVDRWKERTDMAPAYFFQELATTGHASYTSHEAGELPITTHADVEET